MNCGDSVDGVAPSIPLSWTSVAWQGTWKENWWGKAASNCAERVAQGSWESRSGMSAHLWNGLDLHSKVAHLFMGISYHVHPHQLSQQMTCVTSADDSDFCNSDHNSSNRKMDLAQGEYPFETLITSCLLLCEYKIFLSYLLKKEMPIHMEKKDRENHWW